MTNRACGFIELSIRPRVRFQVLRRMIGRPQLGIISVALLATERQFDLVMANQTIGHLRHVRPAHRLGRIDAPMAGQASIRAVQMSANVTRRGKILAGIDGLRD